MRSDDCCARSDSGHRKGQVMKLAPIIKSLLETDLYKFSMGQAIFHQFNRFRTRWDFKCRNRGIAFTPDMVQEIREQIACFCGLRFMEQELDWMRRNIPWLSEDYISYLRRWYPRIEQICVRVSSDPCGMSITAEGEWSDTSMYEVPILAIVSEVYYAFSLGERCESGEMDERFTRILADKIAALVHGKYSLGTFSEFGMRRRYSADMQDWLVKTLCSQRVPGFVGTSNVYLAKKYGVRPCGTMAHEFIMCVGQGQHELNPAYSNKFMMDAWTREYGVENGIALTDTITTDNFLLDFDKKYATLFSGVRHDSGDPFEWANRVIAHYRSIGIDPRTKTLLFSDSLDFERATKIYRAFKDVASVAFGIGTYLSCDLGDDVERLNIVMKVTECNGQPVAKLSDAAGKGMCRDESYVNYLERCIAWRKAHKEN